MISNCTQRRADGISKRSKATRYKMSNLKYLKICICYKNLSMQVFKRNIALIIVRHKKYLYIGFFDETSSKAYFRSPINVVLNIM